MALFQRVLASSPKKPSQPAPGDFRNPIPALSQDGVPGSHSPRRTRQPSGPPSSHPPARLIAGSPAAALRASPASPLFWLSPPVQTPEPGSGCCRSAERTRGRGKCFRGNGPRVGVCKLASVPAGTAAAAGLARSAGA